MTLRNNAATPYFKWGLDQNVAFEIDKYIYLKQIE